MNNWANDVLDTVLTSSDNKNFKGLKICTVKSLNPFIFTYNGVDLGTQEGDTVYIHPLALAPLINEDENLLLEIQNFESSTAYNSPSFTAKITGTIPDFIKNFYLFYKNWCSIYALNVGDSIAVYELFDNSFLVLQKVALDIIQEKEGENEL